MSDISLTPIQSAEELVAIAAAAQRDFGLYWARGQADASWGLVPRLYRSTCTQNTELTINEQIRPTLRADGGDIDLIDVDGNTVIVAFRGTCSQCKMAVYTMKDVVEARLKEFVSEDLVVVEETKEDQQGGAK